MLSNYWRNDNQNEHVTHLSQHRTVIVNELSWNVVVQHFSTSECFCALAHLSDSLIVFKNDCFVCIFTLRWWWCWCDHYLCRWHWNQSGADSRLVSLLHSTASGCDKCLFFSALKFFWFIRISHEGRKWFIFLNHFARSNKRLFVWIHL